MPVKYEQVEIGEYRTGSLRENKKYFLYRGIEGNIIIMYPVDLAKRIDEQKLEHNYKGLFQSKVFKLSRQVKKFRAFRVLLVSSSASNMDALKKKRFSLEVAHRLKRLVMSSRADRDLTLDKLIF